MWPCTAARDWTPDVLFIENSLLKLVNLLELVKLVTLLDGALMKIPTYLKHKPVLEVANYDQLDGPYRNKTDAKGLSVGLAQWNEPGCTEISAKVWRNTGEKWSRQSEELPLHRVIDLATLVCAAIRYAENGNELTSTEDFPISFSTDNEELKRYLEIMKKELVGNKEHLDVSLDRLVIALKKLGKC